MQTSSICLSFASPFVKFYARAAALLKDELAIRPEDLIINLVEVPKENWSFGRGEAQYSA